MGLILVPRKPWVGILRGKFTKDFSVFGGSGGSERAHDTG